ncbi:hypothetical protein ACB092_02G076600 [Castanea dentata]
MCKDLMNQLQHLQRVVNHFTTEQIANNRLQLKALIFIEILHVFSAKVKKAIREEISDGKFCIMVDEARDESMKEQMAVVFRYVNAEGFVKERIYSLLSQHCLDIQNIRRQRYDGASNMRGMWNGLQALILNDCPYAYYIHLKASKQVVPISGFFLTLLFLIKIVSASCKRNEQLKVVNANDIARLINHEELETGSGLNQISTLQRPVETRWSSHFRLVSSLLRMFTPTLEVLQNIIDDAILGEHWAEAESAYESLTSFEFVFILHLEKETMDITDKLCQALQSQSQDILNAVHLVSSTKALIQKFRDDGWDGLLTTLISFCEKHSIDVPYMNARYHHYRVNIFYATIDSQLQEINHRFNEDTMELLRLSSALEPRKALKSFRSRDLCLLVKNFYPQDFTDYEKQVLEKELYHFEYNVVQDPEFKKLKSLSELCQWLVRTRNSEHYKLVYRMVRLVLTLLVSTTTTERAFSAKKVVKTNFRNKMENDLLMDSLMLYIEKDITSTFSLDSIVDDFEDLKERRVLFS